MAGYSGLTSKASAALQCALDCHGRQDFAAAIEIAEAALGRGPDNPALLRILGDSHCRRGDLRAGVGHLRRAHELAPGDAATRFTLAQALAALGDLAGAEALCPAEPTAEWDRLRGYLLQAQGRLAEAAQAYGRVVQANPGDWEIWNNLGNVRRADGDLAGAADALSSAVRLRPDLAALRFNLGTCLAQAERFGEAATELRETTRLAPNHAPAWLDLGKVLRHAGQPGEALSPLSHAARLSPNHPEPLLELARAYVSLVRFDEAEQAYRAAIQARPADPDAYLELGIVLERGNKLDELGELLVLADSHAVHGHDLDYLRALSLRRQGKLEEALRLALQAPAEIEPGRRARLIGRLADTLGDVETAFAAFEEMNRIAAEESPGARAAADEYRRHIEAITAMVDEGWHESWSSMSSDEYQSSPVFLVGFPRSGTTLLDTILMGHPDIEVIEEEPILERVMEELGDMSRLPHIQSEEVGRLRALYLAGLDALVPPRPGRIVIDKLPLNIVGAPLIHRLFPAARFIFAQRHPCDVVLSCFMQAFEINPAMANFLDLGDAAELYDRVLTLWGRYRDILPLRVHSLRYEALVAGAEAEIRPLIDFLGLPWDERMLDNQRTAVERGRIMTPSYDQVTERIYDRASGRWKRYREHMRPVLPLLLPWAERLGYR